MTKARPNCASSTKGGQQFDHAKRVRAVQSGMAQLQIEHKELEPGTVLIALAGRLMLGEEGAQAEALVAELAGQGYRRFILDLSGLTHIDSTGIGRCIASLNKISQAGGELRISGAAGQVREAFRVTRLDRVFRFAPDAPAARRSF